MKNLLVLLIISLGFGSARADLSSGITLFNLVSQALNRTIVYEANVKSDCTFASKNPVKAMKINTDGKLANLNWIEQKILGISIESQEPQKLVGQVNTMKSHNIYWPLYVLLGHGPSGDCQAETKSNEGEIIQTINVLALNGTVPKNILIMGSLNGKPEQRPVSF